MNAEQSLQNALTAKRQENYGIAWELVDWYGIANRDLPELQRTDLNLWIRGVQ